MAEESTCITAPALGCEAPSAIDGFPSPVLAIDDDGEYMTSTDFHRAAQYMEQRGGGFMTRLAALYFHADSDNRSKLRAAFLAEFWGHHRHRVIRHKNGSFGKGPDGESLIDPPNT